MWEWAWENLVVEIIFGILILPLVWWCAKFSYDYFFKSRRIIFFLSAHNNPSRVWRKGIYARDRFMEVYEADTSLVSDATLRHGGGDAGAAYHTEYVDKCILERFSLVTIFEEGDQKKVRKSKNRIASMVYNRVKKQEAKEKQQLKKHEQERRKSHC